MDANTDRESMGRPPRVGDDELVETVERLTTPERPICETEEVADEFPMGNEGMRERLKRAAEDEDVQIRGLQPGGQGGYVWWTIPRETTGK